MHEINDITLDLKRRKGDNRAIFPIALVKEIMNKPDPEVAKQELWNFFEPIKDADVYTHDKAWIKKLIDWQPAGGLVLSAIAEWFPLISSFREIDDSKDCEFVITRFQAGLLWDRLKNEKFVPFPKIQGQPSPEISLPFVEFVIYFTEVCGFHFEKEEPPQNKESTEKTKSKEK